MKKKQYFCGMKKEIEEYIKQSIYIRKVMIACFIPLIIIGLSLIILALFFALS